VCSQGCNLSEQISSTVPDWTREYKAFFAWDPARSLLASIRAYQRHSGVGGLASYVARKIAVLRHRFWSVATGADIPLTTQIGGGLLLPHPNGVVIHPKAIIGVNCLIFQQVTVGARTGKGVPNIGGHVDIGAGAKMLGSVKIGAHVCIGANAVVLRDVPPGKIAIGVPAIILSSSDEGS